MKAEAIKIFFCYAHEDEPLLQNLKKQLRILQRQGVIEMWHDREISAGSEWEREIDKQLNESHIILLLISPDFMDSDFAFSHEMMRAMERHKADEALVIPVILRHVYWQGALFGKLQALPLNKVPVIDSSWGSLDVAFFQVAEGIRKAVELFLVKNKQNQQDTPQKTQDPHNVPELGNQFWEKPHEGNHIGQVLGNYHLTRLLGAGGFSEVYLGTHLHLRTLAAIKVLRNSILDDEVASFGRAAYIVSQLTHPHIIRILDYGVQETTPFFVMDYASKGSLRQNFPSGTRLALPTIVSYVQQIAAALQYAHDNNVLHRDIKPENILVSAQDELLLSDFSPIPPRSSEPLLQSKEYLTALVGTALYMAPEQIMGNVSRASDQYALSVVVYEWISGVCPFSGTLPEITTQHLLVPPPALRGVVDIPPKVESVIMKALAKRPEDRFFTVEAFAKALAKAI